jgi:hypothetical protein
MKSGAFPICKTHIIHITDIQAHAAIIQLSQSHTNNKPNNAISRKAVGFDILATVNNNQDIMTYFELFDPISNHFSLLSFIWFMNIIHERIANIVIAITHKSVLLSTKTRNAPIPLVSHSNIQTHQE